MDLRRRLATAFATRHPGETGITLEGRPAKEVAVAFEFFGPDLAAQLASRMAPGMVRRVVEALDQAYAAKIIGRVPLEVGAAVLRALDLEGRGQILSRLEPGLRSDLETTIQSPPGTAGAVMDPRAVALSSDVTISEALQTLRREGQHVLYNVYVVDRKGFLVGVFNLQELLLAPAAEKVATIVKPARYQIPLTADRQSILDHEGWRSVYSLPVVDDENRYVGAIRYQTLRRLEAESQKSSVGGVTATALGDLFRTGIGGLIEALSSTAPDQSRDPSQEETES